MKVRRITMPQPAADGYALVVAIPVRQDDLGCPRARARILAALHAHGADALDALDVRNDLLPEATDA